MSDSPVDRCLLWVRFFSRISFRRDLPLVLSAFRHRHNSPISGEIWHKIDGVQGFLSAKEAGLLYWAARECPVTGAVIELGSYEGRSTAVFALAGRHVHAVDAWSLDVSDISAYDNGERQADAVFDRFKRNLRQLQIESLIRTHRGLTHTIGETWQEEGAILFVDAGHTHEDVRGDLSLWTPHLHPQGFLLMHDVLGDTYFGVTRAASELMQTGWRVIASAGSVVAFTRDG
jgi:predicted O-methyltransferase YrrM